VIKSLTIFAFFSDFELNRYARLWSIVFLLSFLNDELLTSIENKERRRVPLPTQKPKKPLLLNLILAATVRELRTKRNLSQEKLAHQASVDRTYISGIERARRNITMATLERLMPHLADTPVDFFKSLCAQLEKATAHGEETLVSSETPSQRLKKLKAISNS